MRRLQHRVPGLSHSAAGQAEGLSALCSLELVIAETAVLANDLKEDGFTVVSLHPGSPQTCRLNASALLCMFETYKHEMRPRTDMRQLACWLCCHFMRVCCSATAFCGSTLAAGESPMGQCICLPVQLPFQGN